jgi:hypothetical protein
MIENLDRPGKRHSIRAIRRQIIRCNLRPVHSVMVHLVGGHWDGRAMAVPVDQDDTPWSPIAWPAIDIPWRPLLVYELDSQSPDGVWKFRYRETHYGGW